MEHTEITKYENKIVILGKFTFSKPLRSQGVYNSRWDDSGSSDVSSKGGHGLECRRK